MKKVLFIAMCMTVVMLTACAKETNENGVNEESNTSVDVQETKVTFTDDLGSEITVDNPKRVATLLGSFADMWVLAGGEVYASPDDAWNDFNLDMPEDAVNLGQTKSLNLEKLFEAQPDFIIASKNTKIDMEWKETLENSGIPTAYFDVNDFEDYLRVFKIFTDITGREELYEKYGTSIQKEIEDVIAQSKERIATNGSPKVLSLRASASYVRAKNSEDNVLGELLKDLGCINIADSEESLLENLSLEYILEEDPDFIFFVQIGDDKEKVDSAIQTFIDENPAWQELTAVKEGRVYHMEKMLYNLKPNAKWAESYKGLERILSNEQE